MAVVQPLHAVLTIQDVQAKSALQKAEAWCEAVSCPVPAHGIRDAQFSAPNTATNPFSHTFAVTVAGVLTYADDPVPESETEQAARREQWEQLACHAANRLEGVQILRFSPSRR